ncbi:hypothetical protein OG298_29445 [Streptomyces sp. NBC_01005]|uniref:hypothetical protein n=1 Tax=Streptomyces sp. NBC_01005 TaxID=2903715 RepID=UPI00386819CD|nr:hypothetical protein OG298_29445 [Streptomyces sp. NBC_01005]
MATETEVGDLLYQRGWRTAFTVTERANAGAALVSGIERGCGNDIWRHPRILTGDLGRSLRSAGAIGVAPDTA